MIVEIGIDRQWLFNPLGPTWRIVMFNCGEFLWHVSSHAAKAHEQPISMYCRVAAVPAVHVAYCEKWSLPLHTNQPQQQDKEWHQQHQGPQEQHRQSQQHQQQQERELEEESKANQNEQRQEKQDLSVR